MTDRTDVVVIGAGHNGLVCAGYLARAGLKVLCVEARDAIGGMSAPRTLANQYHFPGLAHVSCPVNPRIRRDLQLNRFGYEPGKAIDTVSLHDGGAHLVLGSGKVAGTGIPDGDARQYPRFLHEYREYARALRPLLENRPPRLKDMPSGDKATLAKLGWNIRMRLGRESMYEFLRVVGMNVHDVLDEVFEDDRLKGALAAESVLGSAMGPRTPGTVLAWLRHLYGGLHGPQSIHTGGKTGLVTALTRSAESAGVSLRTGVRVERVVTEDGAAVGVELSNGETIRAGRVVSNVDPRATFLDLVGAPRLDAMFANRVRQVRGTGTVAKLHLALSGLPEVANLEKSLLGSRLLVAPSTKYVERAFNHSKYGEFSAAPVLDMVIPSVHDSDLAPNGHHVMSVNVAFAPCNLAGGWETQRNEIADQVISQIEHYAPGIRSLIVDQEFLAPDDIEREYGAVEGHWHHGEVTMHQSFMLRPVYGASQYDTPVDGLYLCSAGCHPGGGLTGLPGRNAAKRILEAGAAS